MKSARYTRVQADDVVVQNETWSRRRDWVIATLLFTTIALACLSALMLVELSRLQSSSYRRGFLTELDSIRKVISIEETVFGGGLVYDDADNLYREITPGQPQFVGPPSPDIDAAWDGLLRPLGMVLTGDDASSVAGKTFEEDEGSWLLTLDVYHSLHCVNMLRQSLDVDYYQGATQDFLTYRTHIDHCLDYLRQALQCASDLTPLTYQYSQTRGRRYPIFGAVHTCRNFDAIHDWAVKRLGNYTL
ncbi:unnamed protein product [Discula destructiva]